MASDRTPWVATRGPGKCFARVLPGYRYHLQVTFEDEWGDPDYRDLWEWATTDFKHPVRWEVGHKDTKRKAQLAAVRAVKKMQGEPNG